MKNFLGWTMAFLVVGGVVALLRWAIGSWSELLFWVYLAPPILLVVLCMPVGYWMLAKGSLTGAVMAKASVRGARALVGSLSGVLLVLAGWPAACAAIAATWPKRAEKTFLTASASTNSSYFGVAALLNAGLFASLNLLVYEEDPTIALRFATLWAASLVGFLVCLVLTGGSVFDAIRKSPGPLRIRFGLASVGTLVGLVSSISVLEASINGVPLELELVQQTARRILTFRKVVDGFLEASVPVLTAFEWAEAATGAIYWFVVTKGILELKRRDEDHLVVAQILNAASRPHEALRHARKLKQPTADSKTAEAVALLLLGRREDAQKVAGEALHMNLDVREPCELLAEGALFPLFSPVDAEWLLETALSVPIPDARVALMLGNLATWNKLPEHKESLISIRLRSDHRSYALTTLAAARGDIVEAATYLPKDPESPLEEFLGLRFLLSFSEVLAEAEELETWLSEADGRVRANFNKLAKFEAVHALETVALLWAFSERVSSRSAVALQRTFHGALSVCRDAHWLSEAMERVLMAGGQEMADRVLTLRTGMATDPQGARVVRATVLVATERFEEAVSLLTRNVPGLPLHSEEVAILARAYVRMGSTALAITTLQEHATRTKDANAWADVGTLCVEVRDDAGAEQAYAAAVAAGQESARVLRARVLARLGRGAEARLEYEQCMLHGGDVNVDLEFASFLVRCGDMAAAEKVLREVADTMPALATVKMQLAAVLFKEHQQDEAVQLIQAALLQAPEDDEMLRTAASLLLPFDAQRAITYLRERVRRAGTTANQLELAAALVERERFEEARTVYEALLAANPDDEVIRVLYASSLEVLGDLPAAEVQLRWATDSNFARAEHFERLANFLHRHNRLDEARAEMLRALQLEPGRTSAIATYSRWMADAGNGEDAVLRLRRALEVQKDDVILMDALADIALSVDDFSTVLQLRTQIAEASNRLEDWLELGRCQILAGDAVAARATFERTIACWPEDIRPRSNYARALWLSGEIDEAEEQYQKSTAVRGDLAGPWLDLAYFLSAQHRTDEARAALLKARELEPANFDVYLAVPVVAARGASGTDVADELLQGARVVGGMGELLEAAASYYRDADASHLVRIKHGITTLRGAQFLNQIAWGACLNEKADAQIHALAVHAAELAPSVDTLHTLATVAFMTRNVTSGLAAFRRFLVMAERHQVEHEVEEVALVLCRGVRANATRELIDELRETRNAALWRDWADALASVDLDVPAHRLNAKVAKLAERIGAVLGHSTRRESMTVETSTPNAPSSEIAVIGIAGA